MGRYIVIEDFNDTTNIVSLNGVGPKIFDSIKDAYIEASNWQNGVVVNLDANNKLFAVDSMASSSPKYIIADNFGSAEVKFKVKYPKLNIERIVLVSNSVF